MRDVVGGIARHQRIEIVAADAALHLWKFLGDFGSLALAKRQHVAKQVKPAIAGIHLRQIARYLAEMQKRAVG